MDPVERLLAYHEIGDVIGRYCMLFDDQDWDGLADLWTADASFEVEDKIFEQREVLLEMPMQYTPGPPPMSETATSVSASTIHVDERTSRPIPSQRERARWCRACGRGRRPIA